MMLSILGVEPYEGREDNGQGGPAAPAVRTVLGVIAIGFVALMLRTWFGILGTGQGYSPSVQLVLVGFAIGMFLFSVAVVIDWRATSKSSLAHAHDTRDHRGQLRPKSWSGDAQQSLAWRLAQAIAGSGVDKLKGEKLWPRAALELLAGDGACRLLALETGYLSNTLVRKLACQDSDPEIRKLATHILLQQGLSDSEIRYLANSRYSDVQIAALDTERMPKRELRKLCQNDNSADVRRRAWTLAQPVTDRQALVLATSRYPDVVARVLERLPVCTIRRLLSANLSKKSGETSFRSLLERTLNERTAAVEQFLAESIPVLHEWTPNAIARVWWIVKSWRLLLPAGAISTPTRIDIDNKSKLLWLSTHGRRRTRKRAQELLQDDCFQLDAVSK